MSSRVAIIQPWLPSYRREFYTELQRRGREMGFEIDVIVGEAPPEWSARKDTITLEGALTLPVRNVSIGSRTLLYKSIKPVITGGYDLVILEYAVRNFETYPLLLRLGGKRVAFWGHGKTYTKDIPRFQEMVKYWLVRRGAWFFGYTQKGVDAVVANGVRRDRTTVLNNSIDTEELRRSLSALDQSEIASFKEHYDLRGKTGIYIGALDTYKRIPFLLEAAQAAHELDPEFRLLVGGNGADRPMVEDFSAKNPWLTYLGGLSGERKALALCASEVIVIPGAIGLIALDSLVSGVPIVTTDYRYHGPEFDYLSPGSTAVVTPNDVESYASNVVDLLNDHERLAHMGELGKRESKKYSLDSMVEKFLEGIQGALSTSRV